MSEFIVNVLAFAGGLFLGWVFSPGVDSFEAFSAGYRRGIEDRERGEP